MAGVRHCVMFKYADGADKAECTAAISAAVATLPEKIPEVLSFRFGPDLGLDPGRNHDFVVVADFKSQEDYLTYAKHPDHLAAIADTIKPRLAPGGRVAVQYAL